MNAALARRQEILDDKSHGGVTLARLLLEDAVNKNRHRVADFLAADCSMSEIRTLFEFTGDLVAVVADLVAIDLVVAATFALREPTAAASLHWPSETSSRSRGDPSAR